MAMDMHETYCVVLKDGTLDPPQLPYTFIQTSQRQKISNPTWTQRQVRWFEQVQRPFTVMWTPRPGKEKLITWPIFLIPFRDALKNLHIQWTCVNMCEWVRLKTHIQKYQKQWHTCCEWGGWSIIVTRCVVFLGLNCFKNGLVHTYVVFVEYC